MARLPTIRRHKSQLLHSPGAVPNKTTASTGMVRESSIKSRGISDTNKSAEYLGEYL